MRRLRFVAVQWAICLVAFVAMAVPAAAQPAVFWVSEPAGPGEVVLVYGGELEAVRTVLVRRLVDGNPGTPPGRGSQGSSISMSTQALSVPALQPVAGSLKFVLPRAFSSGIFAVWFVAPHGRSADAPVRLINLPRVEWSQPTRLLPGLNENEAAPGTTIQTVGRNLLLGESKQRKVRVVLRGPDGRLIEVAVPKTDTYSLVAQLPPDIPPGNYEVWVHNGFGGPAGWGSGTRLNIRQPTVWPDRVFNVKDFGARGDNVTDDSGALRRALTAAEQNGGGVVYLPAGTYRLQGWFRLPRRMMLRGEGTDITWLKWPQRNPKSAADFIPAVLYGTGEYGLESLSLVVRNVRVVLHDLSARWIVPVPEVERFRVPSEQARDVFLRRVRIHHLAYSGRPSTRPQDDAQWQYNHWGIINATDRDLTVVTGGVRNVEVSDSQFVGMQRLLDCQNGRFVRNNFSFPMGVPWTDLGGQHIVLEENRIIGASSWRNALLPVRHIYVAKNWTVNIERGEREVLVLDLEGGRRPPLSQLGSEAVSALQARVTSASQVAVTLDTPLVPGAYRGFAALVVAGKGVAQYRTVLGNTERALEVDVPWDVMPDATSLLLVYQLRGHIIYYKNRVEDASDLGRIWGYVHDVVFDGNEIKRSGGMWGFAGSFVQWLNNRLDVAVTHFPTNSPHGNTPEGEIEHGVLGFTIAGRITTLDSPFPYVRGAVLRGNRLSYGHRVLVMLGFGGERRRANFTAAEDVVVDGNQIDHTPVGIELDANVEGAVAAGNTFKDVQEPLRLHAPEGVLVLGAP